MKVSVVIVTYNRPFMLGPLICQLREQTVPVEIVVVDDGSKQAIPCGDRYLWRTDDGYHRTWMVNRGVELASGDIVILLDDDIRLKSRTWVRAHLDVFKDAHVSRGTFYMGRYNDGVFEQTSPYIFGLPGTYWSSVNVAMLKDVWHAVGGYDEQFDGAYGFEDVDFGLRVREAGFRIGKAGSSAIVEHIGEPYCGDDESLMDRNRKLLENKWGDSVDKLMARSGGGVPG